MYSGSEIIYSHNKIEKSDYPKLNFIPSHMTLALQPDDYWDSVAISFAACGNQDQYSKKEGRRISSIRLTINKEDYINNIEKYRKGVANKPIGFREVVDIENLSSSNWKDVQKTLIEQYIPIFVNFYNDQKSKHLYRLEKSEELRRAKGLVVTNV